MSSNKKSPKATAKPKATPPTGVIVSPPANTSEVPDRHTKTSPAYTDGSAPNQVFHFKFLGMSYGTDDKTHAAAMCLSLLMLLIVMTCLIAGSIVKDRTGIEQILNFIGPAFLITIGVAIGKSVSGE